MTWLRRLRDRWTADRDTHPCHCGWDCGQRVTRDRCGAIADTCPTWTAVGVVNQPTPSPARSTR